MADITVVVTALAKLGDSVTRLLIQFFEPKNTQVRRLIKKERISDKIKYLFFEVYKLRHDISKSKTTASISKINSIENSIISLYRKRDLI